VSPIRLALYAILAFLVVRTVRRFMAQKELAAARAAAAKLRPAPGPPPIERVDGKDPHDVLGVKPRASADEIRKAYQKLIAEYHPDKAETLAPEIREIAEQRTRQINRAYEILTRDKG
jgi:DnaJ-domain-containing protein 1